MTNSEPQSGGEIRLAPGVTVPTGVLQWHFARSGGPGGQNVNKRSTKAELRLALRDLPLNDRVRGRLVHLLGNRLVGVEPGDGASGEVVITADEHRTQARNRESALSRLRDLLVRAQRLPRKRKPTKPSKGATERRLENKRQRAEKKQRRRWRPE